ncbi:MAG: hypothetical protein J6S67_04180 [Methanobrevibacter sp.]|nr:hypothetical protein [Methanobrevibacter sp.]
MTDKETIKKYAKSKGVYLWEVAEKLGLSDFYFSRCLRHPLPEDKAQEIFKIIDSIAESR